METEPMGAQFGEGDHEDYEDGVPLGTEARHSIALMAPLILLIVRDFIGGPLPASIFNPDALFAPALFRDLFIDGGDIFAWSFPPPGFIFPDLVMYFTVRALIGDFPAAVHVYALVQIILLYGGLLFLVRLSGSPGKDGIIARKARTGGAALAMLAFLFWVLHDDGPAFALPLQLTHHSGAVVLALFAAGFFFRKLWKVTAIFIFLGCLSDVLFLGFFVLPAALAIFFDADRERRVSRWFRLGAPAAAGLFTFAALRAYSGILFPIVPLEPSRLVDAATWITLASGGIQELFSIFRDRDYTGIAFVSLCACGWLLLLFSRRPRQSPVAYVFVRAAALSAVIMGIAGGLLQNQAEPAARYMLPALLFPLLAVGQFLERRFSTRFALWFLSLFLVTIEMIHATRLRESAPPVPAAAAADCMARIDPGLRDGLASYALAKPVDLFRRRAGSPFRINQIDGTGQPRYWINSAAWYGTEERAPDYNFILSAGLDPAMLRERFGEPDRIIECPGSPVWRYEQSLDRPGPGEIRLWRDLIGR